MEPLIDKRADVVLPALTSICEEVAEAVILLLTVLHLFVGEHIVRCNAAGTHELLHEPVTSAVKPRLRDCSRLSRLQVGPAGSADGVVPVLEAKPVPECKECVCPLATCLLVLVPAVRPGVPVMAQRSDTRRLDTEGDMDDSGGLDDEDAAAAAPAARVQRSTPSLLYGIDPVHHALNVKFK